MTTQLSGSCVSGIGTTRSTVRRARASGIGRMKLRKKLSQTPLAIYMRERKDLLRLNGLCLDCGNQPPAADHVLCANCLHDRRMRERRRNGTLLNTCEKHPHAAPFESHCPACQAEVEILDRKFFNNRPQEPANLKSLD